MSIFLIELCKDNKESEETEEEETFEEEPEEYQEKEELWLKFCNRSFIGNVVLIKFHTLMCFLSALCHY